MKSSKKKITQFKLITLLKTFSLLEIKRFGRFLRSPYHNNKEALVILFKVLRPYYPLFDAPTISRLTIWENIFGAIPFDGKLFKKICFELNSLAEEFLIIEEVKNNEQTKSKLLIDVLKSRDYKRFEKESKALIAKIKAKKELMLQDDFLDLHLLYKNLWDHFEKEKHQLDNTDLEANYSYLYTYSAFEKLKTVSELQSTRRFLNINSNQFTLDLDIPVDDKVIESNSNLFLIYQFSLLVSSPSLSLYLQLKDQLLRLKDWPDKRIIQDGILHLNNYLINEDTKGKLSQINEIFELYKWAALQKIFILNGVIHEEIMVNTTIFALRNQQTSWATEYIEGNKQYLKPRNRDLTVNYLKTIVSYAEQDFEKVIELQATIQPGKTMHYYLSIKSILIRSLFELLLKGENHYSDILIAQMDALKSGLLRNQKFSANKIKSYQNFLKLFRKLYSLFLHPEQNRWDQLRLELTKTSPIIGSPWFNSKLEGLKERES